VGALTGSKIFEAGVLTTAGGDTKADLDGEATGAGEVAIIRKIVAVATATS
jgi:hypothetical protein